MKVSNNLECNMSAMKVIQNHGIFFKELYKGVKRKALFQENLEILNCNFCDMLKDKNQF